MERVEITVRGDHTAFRPPERATVRAEVMLEAGSAEGAYAAATASGTAVTGSITPLHDPESGPVTWWSGDQIRTWAHRPWNQDGKELPVVHHASLTYQVKFRDFARLSAWLGEVTSVPGFRVSWIDWALTAAHQAALTREVRAAAVRQAKEKAQAYADALELGPVHVVALADAGMLGDGLAPEHGGGAAGFTRMSSTGAGENLRFVPEDVSVVASVDARFAVS